MVNIEVPPLRNRKEDVPALTKHFINKYSMAFNKETMSISRSAIKILEMHDYPGNVRELQNIIERAVALAETSTIQVQDLPPEIIPLNMDSTLENVGIKVGDTLEEAEKKLILASLDYCDNNKRKTATMLGLSERNLYNKLKKYNE